VAIAVAKSLDKTEDANCAPAEPEDGMNDQGGAKGLTRVLKLGLGEMRRMASFIEAYKVGVCEMRQKRESMYVCCDAYVCVCTYILLYMSKMQK
jgi:hypothetical protein